MTKRFDNFIKRTLANESKIPDLYSKSFIDLPQEPPYGFWLFPDNKHYTVVSRTAQHEIYALHIIDEFPNFKPAYNELQDAYDALFSLGFTRVVKDPQGKRIYYGEFNLKDPIKKQKAEKFLSDICSFYDYTPVMA